MSEWLWKRVARLCVRHKDRIKAYAFKRPYSNIVKGGGEVYMERYWLFNPYPDGTSGALKSGLKNLLPSVRLHWIRRPDVDRHDHNHPWDARTIILEGAYCERRQELMPVHDDDHYEEGTVRHYRGVGDTATIKFGEYHSIEDISPGGVWTVFITWKYRGTWGFKVDGQKVPWREYLKQKGNP